LKQVFSGQLSVIRVEEEMKKSSPGRDLLTEH
jgi:hypothetical protein